MERSVPCIFVPLPGYARMRVSGCQLVRSSLSGMQGTVWDGVVGTRVLCHTLTSAIISR